MTNIEQKVITDIYNVIKSDDLTTFCLLLKNDNRLLKFCLGRFPILSICYLYNSKKIIKAFEKDLINTKDYIILDEPFVLYRDFKLKCGKAIRLYACNTNLVMPLEIKAILKHDLFVKKYFSKFPPNVLVNKNLIKIYNLNGQKCVINNKKIKISAKKLSKKAKKAIILTNVIGFSVAALCGMIVLIMANIIGLGTITSPKKIYSAGQFMRYANNSNICIALQNNITLDSSFECNEFNGVIYGNNKTVTIKYNYETSMFNEFNGNVQDLNIIYLNENIDVSKDMSLFCTTNNGEIDNVNITFDGNINYNSSNNTTFFSGIAVNNNNLIKNCSAKFNAKTNSSNNKDTFISAICSVNYNLISNCMVTENSKIETTNTDVSGICNYNTYGKTISECKNYADITQNVNLSTWSPAVAGVVLNNIGNIENCYNYGNLKIDISVEATADTYVMIGGICASNNALIYHSKNCADIFATTQNLVTYAGGICGYVNTNGIANSPKIQACISEGELSFAKSNETWLYCGGIAGYMRGTVTSCCSASTFTNQYNKENKVMTAQMVGVTLYSYYYDFSFNLLKELHLIRNNNAFLQNDIATHIVGVAYLVNDPNYDNIENENNIYGNNILEDDSIILASIEEFQSCEQYW